MNPDKTCPFCNGTKKAKYVDLAELSHLENKSYPFEELLEKYGEIGDCPECVSVDFEFILN
ncbi:MAG: hypothetical protein GY870_19355 [archaeon]|nr:hypothetical protein [archaeon]